MAQGTINTNDVLLSVVTSDGVTEELYPKTKASLVNIDTNTNTFVNSALGDDKSLKKLVDSLGKAAFNNVISEIKIGNSSFVAGQTEVAGNSKYTLDKLPAADVSINSDSNLFLSTFSTLQGLLNSIKSGAYYFNINKITINGIDNEVKNNDRQGTSYFDILLSFYELVYTEEKTMTYGETNPGVYKPDAGKLEFYISNVLPSLAFGLFCLIVEQNGVAVEVRFFSIACLGQNGAQSINLIEHNVILMKSLNNNEKLSKMSTSLEAKNLNIDHSYNHGVDLKYHIDDADFKDDSNRKTRPGKFKVKLYEIAAS